MCGPPDNEDRVQPRPSRRPRRLRAHEELHEEAGNGSLPDVLSHPLVADGEAQLIEGRDELARLTEHLCSAGVFAYDTEFIGERTYFTRTCLVQVAAGEGIWIIDPLGPLDCGPLWRLLDDPGVEKVVHAGTPDLELALRHTGGPPRGVFDTQIAAGFCGLAYPSALRTVVETVTPATLSPGLKFSQWDHRPLTAMQLRYAADDVRYLLLLRDALLERARELGNEGWLGEECRRLERPEEYEPNPHARRLKAQGAGSLTHRQRHVLRRLIEWREGVARSRDLSPRVFMPDEGLLGLARARPGSGAELTSIKGVPRALKAELGEEIASVIVRAGDEPLDRRPKRVNLSEAQKAAIERTCEAVVDLAAERSIAMGLVATKKEIRLLASASLLGDDPGESRLMSGWRRELLEPVLRDLGFA